jgi:hypothetical protein
MMTASFGFFIMALCGLLLMIIGGVFIYDTESISVGSAFHSELHDNAMFAFAIGSLFVLLGVAGYMMTRYVMELLQQVVQDEF